MVLVFGLALARTAQPTNNAVEEKGKYIADCQCRLKLNYFKKQQKLVLTFPYYLR